MKVLLLNLPSPSGMRILRDMGGGFGTAFYAKQRIGHTGSPPVHEVTIAAILKNNGFEVTILDGQLNNFQDLGILFREIEKINPQVIISRVSAPSLDSDLQVISSLKERLPKTLMIGWGSLCKLAPQELWAKSQFDFIIGDGEIEFIIVQALNDIIKEKTASIGKVQYLDLSEYNFSRDLDSLPIPAYDLLDMKNYVSTESTFVLGGSSEKLVQTFSVLGSRGCSFNCMYCVYPVIFGSWRGRSPKKIVDEIEILVKDYGVKALWFEDQAFSFDVKRATAICEEILNRDIAVNWACETRADKLSPDLLEKMKRAGCSRIQIGIETGDPELFKTLGKKGCDLEHATQSIRAIQKQGILVDINFMVGLPGESWQTIENTAEYINKVNPDSFSVSIITPFPRTPLYEIAEKNGWILTKDWNNYGFSNAVMSIPTFTATDMEKARNYLSSQASLKRQWKVISNDLKHWRFRAAAKKILMGFSKITKRAFKHSRN